jgi:hypothetical protein
MTETGPTDDLLRRLLAAVAAQTSDTHVERLLTTARAEAEQEIVALVKSAYKALLLRRATEQLEGQFSTAPKVPATAPPLAPVPPRSDEINDTGDTGETACYIYAITSATSRALPTDAIAIDPNRPIETIRHADLHALVSHVPLDEFGQAALDERVTDPQWVEEKVRAHDQVIKRAMAAAGTDGAVLPCRFCTVVRSDDDVRALLAANHDGIAATLDLLRGKQEWGVKIYADLTKLARHRRHAAAGQRDDDAAATSGKSYLERKRHEDSTRNDADRLARAQAEECHTIIVAAAADAAILPRRSRSESEAIFNAAYLVADQEVSRFHDVVAALAERYQPLGIEFEITGPWPAYNFVRLDLSLQAAA